MKYMNLAPAEKANWFKTLSDMQDYLIKSFSKLNVEEASAPGPSGAFAPIEQVWHLADLEREGLESGFGKFFLKKIRFYTILKVPRLPKNVIIDLVRFLKGLLLFLKLDAITLKFLNL